MSHSNSAHFSGFQDGASSLDGLNNSSPDLLKQINLYISGGVRKNEAALKLGAWSFILEHDSNYTIRAKFEEHQNADLLEFTALLHALKTLKEPCSINVISSNRYLLNVLENPDEEMTASFEDLLNVYKDFQFRHQINLVCTKDFQDEQMQPLLCSNLVNQMMDRVTFDLLPKLEYNCGGPFADIFDYLYRDRFN